MIPTRRRIRVVPNARSDGPIAWADEPAGPDRRLRGGRAAAAGRRGLRGAGRGGTGPLLALSLVGVGLVALISLVFMEVGLSEDRERERLRSAGAGAGAAAGPARATRARGWTGCAAGGAGFAEPAGGREQTARRRPAGSTTNIVNPDSRPRTRRRRGPERHARAGLLSRRGARLAGGQQGRRRRRARAPARTRPTSTRAGPGSAGWPRPGWPRVTWPREVGGRGLGPIEQVTVNQEISRAQVPGILDVIGIGMLGPCLIAHGSEEQKSRYLGPMLHGDEVWCQMFSEPAAGSDLAAVQTRARQGDDGSWTLNGQKVWTTNAQFASYGLLLARTDADVPKHKGLTMFIVPMDAPGVTVRGLRQISGEAEFNEVFFDDVRLDEDAVVGGVGNGWGTALTVLMYERLTIGFGSEGFGSPARLAETLAADDAARLDSDARRRLGEVITEFLAVRFNGYRALTMLARGPDPRPRGGAGQGDDGQRGDRRHRSRAPTSSGPRPSTSTATGAI